MVYPSLFRFETIAISGTSIPGIPMVRQTAPVVPSTAGRTSTFCAIHLGEGRQSASHCQSPREPSAWNDRDHWHFDQATLQLLTQKISDYYLCQPLWSQQTKFGFQKIADKNKTFCWCQKHPEFKTTLPLIHPTAAWIIPVASSNTTAPRRMSRASWRRRR